MKLFDFLKRFLKAERSIEEKVLENLKQGKSYDVGKIWEEKSLANLEKLDKLLLILLAILRREGIPIGKITREELMIHLFNLVGSKNSLLQRSRTLQLKEIEILDPEKWFFEFEQEIEHLNQSLRKILRDYSQNSGISRREWLKRVGLGIGGASYSYVISSKFEVPDRIVSVFVDNELKRQIQAKYRINVIGHITTSNLQKLDALLANVEREWDNFSAQMKYVKTINIFPLSMMRRSCANTITDTINLTHLDSGKLVHELIHIYHANHPLKEQFDKEWRLVANHDYRVQLVDNPSNPKSWKDKNVRSSIAYGFMSQYGSTNFLEDVAEFAASVYSRKQFINVNIKLNKKENPQNFSKYHIGRDTRYIKKLMLLDKYGFISHAEFELVKPYYLPIQS
ncbi:hypothetical protein HYX03_02025 [Candidatus Woesearchaeota archaeon]|nr:hypothetical protein [Candidatus Woesearchaeota archaeon]